MNEDQSDEISDRDTMGGPITDQQTATSERAPCETARPVRVVAAVSTGSAPWAWTHNREMEYWPPAGRSRAEAIAEGKRRGYKTFWIAQTRRMTEDEKEEYDGSWIVDPSTEERISPNVEATQPGPL